MSRRTHRTKASSRGKKGKGRGLARARAEMERKGTLGSYGHHSEHEMHADIRKGGKVGKKAQFALNMHKIAKRHGKKSQRKSARK